MKKILSLGIILASIATVSAADISQYGSVKLLYSIPSLTMRETEDNGNTVKKSKQDIDSIVGLSLAYGTKIDSFRVETELAFRTPSKLKKVDGEAVEAGKNEKHTINSFALNGYYDLDTGVENLSVYAGLGLGITTVSVLRKEDGMSGERFTYGYQYSLTAGLNYVLNNSTSIDFGYKYSKNDIEDGQIKIENSEIFAGVRYGF
jgi:opacity protein-like surface antigen